MTAPAASQTAKYPIAITHKETGLRRVPRNIGSADGNIIATIMASHMSRNMVAELSQLWPFIRIHIMDMVQPPGIVMPPPMVRQK